MTQKARKLSKTTRVPLYGVLACALAYGMPTYAEGNVAAKPYASQAGQRAGTVLVTVVDQNNEPVVGASVVVMSTKAGAATDVNGRCSVDAKPGDKLQVSYIGFDTQTLTVGNNNNVLVTLGENKAMLDEIVVVGYGTMRKSDVTGSIAVAKGADMIKAQSFGALDNLRGKVSGVNIFSNSEQGTTSPRVIIRGMATINASTDPLYVVDGVVMNDFAMMNPNDIESIEVLKDASATAIYGARGANGVIMVTTKRGLSGTEGTRMSYQGSVSIRHMARKMEVMNAREWCDAFMKGLENENKYQGTSWKLERPYWFSDRRYFDANGNPLYDTDWQKEATRTAIGHNHQLNIQQGTKTSSMGAFLNYSDYQGIMKNTWTKRISGKLAYDANPTKWLTTGINLMVNHTWDRHTDEGGGGQEARRTMIEMLPWLPVRTPDGSYTTSNSPSEMVGKFGFEGMSNPVMILDMQKRLYYNTQVFGNAAFTFHILPGLDLKTQLGIDWHAEEGRRYASRELNNISQTEQGVATNGRHNNLYWQEETYLTYNRTLKGLHRVNAMLGMSWQAYASRYNYSEAQSFESDFFEDLNMGTGKNPRPPGSNYDEWKMNSYFLRLAYTYNDRYSATFTARSDGSSKFGKNNKYAFFPSAGLAWIVSEESWLKDNSWLSNLKLHTSYGLTGNSEIATYRSLARVGSGTVLLDGKRAGAAYISSLANPDLKWEKTAQFDVGFDLGLFNNAVNLDFSYYYKHTTDLLLNTPIPHSSGFGSVYKNIGEVKNSGIDFMLTAYPVRTKDFTWTSILNLNYNTNKILKLGKNNEDIEILEWVGGPEGILRVGESMGSFYGYKRLGVWTEEDKAAGRCTEKMVGRAKREEKKSILGKGIPDWTGSWTNTLNYKNWDLTVEMQFVTGVQTMQQFYHSVYDRFGITNGLKSILYDAYNGSNPYTMQQMLYLTNSPYDSQKHAGQDTTVDSSWVVDGSYLRCNMVQLGYTFAPATLKTLGLNALHLYLSANNLFLLCSKDFKGYDPEMTSQGSKFGQNMAFFSLPRSRVFTLGVNVTF